MANNWEKYVHHCIGIDPFVTLMGNFNSGPISYNDIVSTTNGAVKRTSVILVISCHHIYVIDIFLFVAIVSQVYGIGKRQIICQSADYLSFTNPTICKKTNKCP